MSFISGKELLNLLPKNEKIIGLEIGIDIGHTADFMLKNLENLTLHGIDPYVRYVDWNGSLLSQEQRDWCMNSMLNTMNSYKERFVFHKKNSDDCVDDFLDESFDYVFIDGVHTYEQVLKDCQNFYPKLKHGGIFSGHDYEGIIGVRKAVDEFAESVNAKILKGQNDIWYWYKK